MYVDTLGIYDQSFLDSIMATQSRTLLALPEDIILDRLRDP